MKPTALIAAAFFALTLTCWPGDAAAQKLRDDSLDSMGYPTNATVAYAKGQTDARRDLTNGVLSLKTAGLPGPERPEYERLLAERCKVRLEPLAGCWVTEGLGKYIDGYNEVVTAHVQLKYGTNILEALRTEAGDNLKKARTAASATDSYTVKSGDTLSKIASHASVPLKALLKANPDVDPLKLRIGHKILIPVEKVKKTSNHPAG